MQRFYLEIDYARDALLNDDWIAPLGETLQQLGLETEVVLSPQAIPNAAFPRSRVDLHRIMYGRGGIDRQLWVRAREERAWYAHLMVARTYQPGYLGLMFDFGVGSRHREGGTIFSQTIKRYADASSMTWTRLMARTALHELGHVFNLGHRNDRSDLSLMTQTQFLRRAPGWPQTIQFEYAQRDRRYLRENPRRCKPGTNVDFQHRNPRDAYEAFASAPASDSPDITLSVVQASEDHEVELGTPLELLVEVKHRQDAGIRFASPVSLAHGHMLLQVKDEFTAAVNVFSSPLMACGSALEDRAVGKGETLTFTEPIFLDRSGFLFSHTGDYALRVALKDGDDPERWHVSDPLHLHIVSPRQRADDLIQHLFDPAVGQYLYLEGAGYMIGAHRKVVRLARDHADAPLAAPLLACLGNVAKARALHPDAKSSTARKNRSKAVQIYEQALCVEPSVVKRGYLAGALIHLHTETEAHDEAAKIKKRFSKEMERCHGLHDPSNASDGLDA